jgi:hypothetical protein
MSRWRAEGHKSGSGMTLGGAVSFESEIPTLVKHP